MRFVAKNQAVLVRFVAKNQAVLVRFVTKSQTGLCEVCYEEPGRPV